MDPRLAPGTVCMRKSETSGQVLVVELDGPRAVAVRYREEPRFFEVAADELTVAGSDPASARALQLRWRTSQRAVTFPKGKPVRTAMVLCAGLGTRLRPLTEVYPKPAVPFFDGPLVRYSFALLKGAGVEKVVVNTHHLPKVMAETAAREAQRQRLELAVSHEPVIQGTGGGVRDARKLLGDEPFVLLNGDAFLSFDLKALLAAHQARADAATLAVAPMPPGESFKAVEATPDGDVRRIAGVGEAGDAALEPWHFVGAHVVEPSIFDFIPATGEQDINRTVYTAMVRAGLKVRACPVTLGAWADLGTPRRYLSACEEILTGVCDLSPLGAAAPVSEEAARALRTASLRAWLHPSAKVTGRIEAWAAIGRDTLVEASVGRAAVLPGTRIAPGEPLVDLIASGELRLRAE